MIYRFRAWRRTPTGIWSEWFAGLSIASGLAVASYALGWHWAVSVVLALLAAFIGALIVLLLSIRNDLGDTLPQESAPEEKSSAPAMKPGRRLA